LAADAAEFRALAHRLPVGQELLHLGEVAHHIAFDACLYDRTMHHYTRALELATKVDDAYLQALALSYAGLATEEHGHPDDGLKMLQYGQVKAWDIPSDDQRMRIVGVSTRVAVEACARADSATALARLGYWDAAYTEFATSRELWQPTPTDTSGGDLDIMSTSGLCGLGMFGSAFLLARGVWRAGVVGIIRAA